jgi:hypothetical protein
MASTTQELPGGARWQLEEWVLVRVARGLAVPPLGGVTVSVKKTASVKKAS